MGEENGIVSSSYNLSETENDPIMLTIIGQNSKFSCHRGRLLLRIKILLKNKFPQFVQPPTSLTVSELVPNGTVITRYEAIDRDTDNAKITYSVSSIISNVILPFEIDPVTGDLRVVSPLDFETEHSYIVSVRASNPDGIQSTTATVILIVDENDNIPQFVQPSYNASIIEGSSLGTFVVRVEATDADFGPRGTFNLSILQNSNFNNTFEITQDGNITLANRVDREQIEQFNLTVAATDGGTPSLTSFTTIIITIEDVNDNPPKFAQSIIYASIREDVETPSEILTVTAYDADSINSNNSQIVFSLDSGGNIGRVFNLTQIDNNNAVLQLIKSVDFETLDSYRLQIQASDQGVPTLSSMANVIISVTDVNEAPAIITGEGTVRIQESVPVGFRIARLNTSSNIQNASIVSVTSSGSSGSSSGTMQFKIVQVDTAFYVAIREELDFEINQNFTIQIEVSNSTSSNNIFILNVQVIDVNEFPPVFEEPGNFSIVEEQLSGTFVGQVRALDADAGPMSSISYSILRDTAAASLFSIDSNSGNITTAQILDREQLQAQNLFPPSRDSTETINVMATDNIFPFRSTVIGIPIMLIDINDNSPILQAPSNPVSVLENQTAGLLVHTVTATDQDIGKNGQITFSLEAMSQPFPFEINSSSGVITTNAVLDAESNTSFTLIVTATDNGETPRNSSIIFMVFVTDINDNVPTFPQTTYVISVQENATVGDIVLALDASDEDRDSPDSDIRYTIISMSPPDSQSTFIITQSAMNTSSFLSVARQLDFESIQQYNLEIEATDNGTPSLSSRTTARINIEDVDETPPRFFGSCDETVNENVAIGTSITVCPAADIQDGTNNPLFNPLMFRITSGNINDTFRIVSGTVTLQKMLDRETVEVYELVIEITDLSGLRNTQNVVITVTDINDNPPVITNPNSSVFVSAMNIFNNVTNFFTLQATDADAGINAELNFATTSVQINPNGTSAEVEITVSNRGGIFPISTTVTLELELPCVLQGHNISSSSGQLSSLFLCNISLGVETIEIISGGILDLECSVVANFVPSRYEFIHNDNVISSSSGRTLSIQNFSSEQTGNYSCKTFLNNRMLRSDDIMVNL